MEDVKTTTAKEIAEVRGRIAELLLEIDDIVLQVNPHIEAEYAIKIGYVPADCNEVLARLMDGGKALSAKLTGKEKLGSWNKLHMEVALDD